MNSSKSHPLRDFSIPKKSTFVNKNLIMEGRRKGRFHKAILRHSADRDGKKDERLDEGGDKSVENYKSTFQVGKVAFFTPQ